MQLPFDDLLSASLPRLRAFVRMRASPRLLAHESSSDLAQSVCREALQHRDRCSFDSDVAFRDWLARLAIAKLVDRDRYHAASKRNGGRVAASLQDVAGEDGELVSLWNVLSTPSADAVRKEDLRQLETAMARLSEEHREVIALARLLELPHATVAAVMHRSEVAVRQLLARALVELAGMLT